MFIFNSILYEKKFRILNLTPKVNKLQKLSFFHVEVLKIVFKIAIIISIVTKLAGQFGN